jgi:hypothetical protein
MCNSLNSTLRTPWQEFHVSDRANIPALTSQHPVLPDPIGGFERYRDFTPVKGYCYPARPCSL